MDAGVLALTRATHDPFGIAVLAVSSVLALVAAFVLRPRVAPAISLVILVAAGAGLGWGGMLLRDDPHPAEFVAAVALLAVLVPAHVRIVLGPFGRRDAA